MSYFNFTEYASVCVYVRVLWRKKEKEGEGLSYSDKTLCLSVGNCRSSSNCMSSLNDGALNSYTFHTIAFH